MPAAASKRSGKLVGRKQPRLWTPPLRTLTRKTTLGYECINFAERMLGVDLLPWQRWWLLHALEVDQNGDFRYRTVLTLVSRQNGKTHLLKILALYFMYLGRARLTLGSAQSLDIAREAWQGAVDLAQSDAELAAEIDIVRRTNGEQELRLTNGARYRIAASTGSAGRGLSVDLLILDELREHANWAAWGALSKTTIARPNALTIAISNAGSDTSTVLNALRENALAGTDPALGVFEWSAEPNADLDDRRGWQQANPALGHTLTERALEAALGTDPPATFRTECLCTRVEQLGDMAFDLDAWRDGADPTGTLDGVRSRVCLGLDCSPDLAHITLIAAAPFDDGRIRIEPVAAWTNTNDARRELAGICETVKARGIGWLPGGPAAALAPDLRGLKNAEELKADVPAICQSFSELVSARRILHGADPLLEAQIGGTIRVYAGDGWRYARRGAGHCDASYASAIAVWLARTLPVKVRPKVVVARPAA